MSTVQKINNDDKLNTIRLTKAQVKLKTKDSKKIKIFCPGCQSVLKVLLEDGGLPVSCSQCGEYLIVPKERFAPSVVIGEFVIKEKLGEGGAGTVFLAYQRSLDRDCALKILHDDIEGTNPLLKEARLAAKLNHPNIVQCYAVNTDNNLCYYAMEYVNGKTLKSVLKKNWKLTPLKALGIVIKVAEALNYAWKENRITHHDIKPENIMINDDGTVKLADMGLARLELEHSHHDDDNCLQGTPEYICPEEIKGDPVDYRGDIYSLGVVLFQAVTGNLPFQEKDTIKLLKKHLEEDPPEPNTYTPSLPGEFNSLIMKMLEKDPEQRFPDYDELILELKKLEVLCNAISLKDSSIFKLNESLDVFDSERITRDLFRFDESADKAAKSRLKPIKIAAVFVVTMLSVGLIGYGFLNMNQAIARQQTPDSKTVIAQKKPLVHDYRKLRISSLLPNPIGYDGGNEQVTISNTGRQMLNLGHCKLEDESGNCFNLTGMIQPGKKLIITLPRGSVTLDNRGDTIKLISPESKIVSSQTYKSGQVKEGLEIAMP